MTGPPDYTDHAIPFTGIQVNDTEALAECCDPDGSVSLWWVRYHCDSCAAQAVPGDASPRSAPHDQNGPMPESLQARVDAITTRHLLERTLGAQVIPPDDGPPGGVTP